jgi:hypothetical protein
MADDLYLSLWWSHLQLDEIPATIARVLEQVPFSASAPAIGAASVYPLTYNEPKIYQRIYDWDEFAGAAAEQRQLLVGAAVAEATEILHDDYAYEFEANWDLWTPDENGLWGESPNLLRVTAFGPNFDEGVYQQEGQMRLDFGPDSPFLYEEHSLDEVGTGRLKLNVTKLVTLTNDIERNCGIASRLLWSDAEDNLAQKLLHRLQKLN